MAKERRREEKREERCEWRDVSEEKRGERAEKRSGRRQERRGQSTCRNLLRAEVQQHALDVLLAVQRVLLQARRLLCDPPSLHVSEKVTKQRILRKLRKLGLCVVTYIPRLRIRFSLKHVYELTRVIKSIAPSDN